MEFKEFSGCHLPIITPFKDDFSLDEDGLRRLIDYYIDEIGVNGIVPCGTTGESPTLSNEEHDRVIEIVVAEVDGRVPVMAGTGSNSTSEAIERTKHAQSVGVDATLQVAPYYNKPTQAGFLAHFEAVAAATELPIFIYNIPGRTAKNIEPETILKLAEIDNIIGLKDAAGDLGQTMQILATTKNGADKFYHMSGEDKLTYSTMCLGGDGAIAAVAHVVGKEMTEMCRLALAGEYAQARDIHYHILPAINTLFIESNPSPVKEAMSMMGLPAGPTRLPLVPLQPGSREKLKEVLTALGKI